MSDSYALISYGSELQRTEAGLYEPGPYRRCEAVLRILITGFAVAVGIRFVERPASTCLKRWVKPIILGPSSRTRSLERAIANRRLHNRPRGSSSSKSHLVLDGNHIVSMLRTTDYAVFAGIRCTVFITSGAKIEVQAETLKYRRDFRA